MDAPYRNLAGDAVVGYHLTKAFRYRIERDVRKPMHSGCLVRTWRTNRMNCFGFTEFNCVLALRIAE